MTAPTFLFIGGEDSDFTSVGGVAVDTTASFRRSTYSRCALKVAALAIGDGWNGSLASAVSALWATTRVYMVNDVNIASNPASRIITFKDGATARLALTATGAAFTGTSAWTYKLVKINAAGTVTTLVTTSQNLAPSLLQKLDVFVNYGTSGEVQVYLDGTKIIDYSGDVTTDSATTLSGIVLGSPAVDGASGATYWSECIVSDSDTRGMALATLPVNAAGNTQAWTGANTDVNEVTLNDATSISTTTAGDVSEWTVTVPSAISSTTGVLGVAVKARAAAGSTGPQNIQAVVRTGATDFPSSNLSGVSTTLASIGNVWTTNPNTSQPWVATDITAAGFNIGLKAIA